MQNERSNIRKELEQLAPRLAKMQGKGDGFTTPDHYFSNLQEQLLEQVSLDQETAQAARSAGASSNNWRLNGWPLFRLAPVFATLTLLLAAAWFIWWQPHHSTKAEQPLFAELSEEELQNYVLNNIEDFNTDLIISASGEYLDLNTFDPGFIPEEELEMYLENLLEEGLDLEEFM